MSTSAIEIDDETLARLNGHRRGDEPLGHTIRRLAATNPPESAAPGTPAKRPIKSIADMEAWFARMEANPLSDEAIEAIEQVIADRDLPINKLDHWDDPDEG